jgi:hypothetical protein
MPVQTRARRLHETPHKKRAFVSFFTINQQFDVMVFQKIWQYLCSSVDNICDAYIEKDCQLDEGEIKRLSNHKYASVSASILDELCMQR